MKSNMLTAVFIKTAKPGSNYADGGGLYLQVTKGKQGINRSWVFRWTSGGKTREMGLGSVNDRTLIEARAKARECRLKLLEGIDPIAERQAKLDEQRAAALSRITFEDVAEAYIASHAHSWKNAVHAAQWASTLKTYAFPKIGKLPVASIGVPHVLSVIEPIWYTKTETASRVRGRIEKVLAYATVRGQRSGDNPAQWTGNLKEALPARSAVSKVNHHRAVPVNEIPRFMEDLRERDSISARALEFLALTAARTGEVIGARWDEIDLKAKTWVVPASRMKAKVEHVVPLSSRALEILKGMAGHAHGYIFPGAKEGQPLSNQAMSELMKDITSNGFVPHGLRSSFSDWVGDRTSYPHEVREFALAHQIPDKAAAAYRRYKALDKRARLMEDWARYCGSTPAIEATDKVVPLRSA